MSVTEGIVEVIEVWKECLQGLAARRGFPAKTSTLRCSQMWNAFIFTRYLPFPIRRSEPTLGDTVKQMLLRSCH